MSSGKWRPFCLGLNALTGGLLACSLLIPRFALTHWGRVTHICVSKLTIISPDNGLSPERILRNTFLWNLHRNAFENGVCEMATILSRPQWVNKLRNIAIVSLMYRVVYLNRRWTRSIISMLNHCTWTVNYSVNQYRLLLIIEMSSHGCCMEIYAFCITQY